MAQPPNLRNTTTQNLKKGRGNIAKLQIYQLFAVQQKIEEIWIGSFLGSRVE